MKANKVILILFFPFLIEIIVSCCNCSEPEVATFTHTNVLLEHLDNSGESSRTTISDSILKEAYGLQINLDREFLACNPLQNHSFFISSYALSCDCNQIAYIPREYVTDIIIISSHDFDNTHLAGDDISEYFKVLKSHSYQSITEYLKKEEKDFVYDYLSTLRVQLLLMTPPTLNEFHEFKVQIFLSDGRILEQTTTPIYLI